MKENKKYIHGEKGVYKYCDKDTSGIYVIVNDITKEFYIGSTRDLNRRLSHHFGLLRRGKSTSKKFQKSFDEWGYANFSYYLLYKTDDTNNMRERENDLLEENSGNVLLLNTSTINGTWNNEGNPFQEQRKEVSQKISLAKKGKRNINKMHLVVADGVLYKSYQDAEDGTAVNSSTVHRRVNSKSPAFVNWYRAESEDDIKIIDERFISIPHGAHIYEIEGIIYYNIREIAEKYDITTDAVSTLTKSSVFSEWKKHIL